MSYIPYLYKAIFLFFLLRSYFHPLPSFSARKRLKFAQIFSGKGRQEFAEFEEPVISSTPVSREYSLPERVDVNSQEEYSTFLLYSKKLDFKSYYYCIPRISPEVYLVLEVVPLKDFIHVQKFPDFRVLVKGVYPICRGSVFPGENN